MRLAVLFLAASVTAPAHAASRAEIEYTVAQVLMREGARFVSHDVGDEGQVVLVFGANEPLWRVEKTVEALQSHPDIARVIWTRLDGELCPIR